MICLQKKKTWPCSPYKIRQGYTVKWKRDPSLTACYKPLLKKKKKGSIGSHGLSRFLTHWTQAFHRKTSKLFHQQHLTWRLVRVHIHRKATAVYLTEHWKQQHQMVVRSTTIDYSIFTWQETMTAIKHAQSVSAEHTDKHGGQNHHQIRKLLNSM